VFRSLFAATTATLRRSHLGADDFVLRVVEAVIVAALLLAIGLVLI